MSRTRRLCGPYYGEQASFEEGYRMAERTISCPRVTGLP